MTRFHADAAQGSDPSATSDDRSEGVTLSDCRADFPFAEALLLCPGAASHAGHPGLPGKLRGALGAELRPGASAPALAGEPCPWLPPCALDVMWRPRGDLRPGYPIPLPWVIAVDAADDDLLVTLRLFGDAADYLSEATEAMIRGLARGLSGIGPLSVADRRFRRANALPPLPAQTRILLDFITPLVLRHDQTAHADPSAMLRSLLHRVEGLLWWSGRSISAEIPSLSTSIAEIDSHWLGEQAEEWARYSAPQRQAIAMQGVTGRLLLSGPTLSRLADLIGVGSVTHAGGRTAYGQGRFVVEGWE